MSNFRNNSGGPGNCRKHRSGTSGTSFKLVRAAAHVSPQPFLCSWRSVQQHCIVDLARHHHTGHRAGLHCPELDDEDKRRQQICRLGRDGRPVAGHVHPSCRNHPRFDCRSLPRRNPLRRQFRVDIHEIRIGRLRRFHLRHRHETDSLRPYALEDNGLHVGFSAKNAISGSRNCQCRK